MANEWYIVQTYTGYEGKVSRVIQQKLDNGDLSSDIVKSIKVPEEEVVEIKDGKKKVRKNKLLAGYIMAELDLPDLGWKDTCNKIRHIQGVSGFVGTASNERPRPISADEAKNILMRSGEIKGEKPVRIQQRADMLVELGDGEDRTFGAHHSSVAGCLSSSPRTKLPSTPLMKATVSGSS